MRSANETLRDKKNSRKMSISAAIEYGNEKSANVQEAIDSSQCKVEEPEQMTPNDECVSVDNETHISELGFSTRLYNGLMWSDIETVGQLLNVKSPRRIRRRNGLGVKSWNELIQKMRSLGHDEWADLMVYDILDRSDSYISELSSLSESELRDKHLGLLGFPECFLHIFELSGVFTIGDLLGRDFQTLAKMQNLRQYKLNIILESMYKVGLEEWVDKIFKEAQQSKSESWKGKIRHPGTRTDTKDEHLTDAVVYPQ